MNDLKCDLLAPPTLTQRQCSVNTIQLLTGTSRGRHVTGEEASANVCDSVCDSVSDCYLRLWIHSFP